MYRPPKNRIAFLLLLTGALFLSACDTSNEGLALRPTSSVATSTVQPTVVSQVLPTETPLVVHTDTQAPPTTTPRVIPTYTTAPVVAPTDTNVPTVTQAPTYPPVSAALAESAHPYAKNFNDSWLVSNPDVKAGGTRAHFSRIDLEKDVDWLIVMDGKDAEMQRFTGSYPNGVWTDAIPGSLVKLRLVSDGSVQQWGFTLDKLEAVSYSTLAYSPHPYPNNAKDLRWTINNAEAGAQGTKVHFSRLELESNVDWVQVTDLTGTTYQWLTGNHPDGVWSISVPGNGVYVKLISDGSVVGWGINIDQIMSAPPDRAEAQPETGKSLAESKHPTSDPESWTLVNTDSTAAFTKVHFTRIELRSYNSITLLDGNDKSVQVLSNDMPDGGWSDDIPGRVVKIKLSGCCGWGFRIDQMASGPSKASLVETRHPTSELEAFVLENPDPKANFTKVHFTRIELRSYNSITLLDGNDKSVQVLSNDMPDGGWSDDIPGRVVKIKLSGCCGWGFRIDQMANGEP